jgi:hypothetical protein
MSWDDVAPRRLKERYRIYRLRGGELTLVATTGTPGGVGVAAVTLHGEGEFPVGCACGVLDALPDGTEDDQPGVWIVNPWEAGR